MSDLTALPEFKFKGARTYVQGPDLFDAVSISLQSLGDGYVKDLTFRSFTKNHCHISTGSLGENCGKIICEGYWRSNDNDKLTKYWVLESDQPVSVRQRFEEEKITEKAAISGNWIEGVYVPEFSMIENIVALTKKFHNTQLPLASGKWVFGQIMMQERLPESCEKIQIENYQNITNRFSRNRIVLDGKHVGEIRFIVA